MREKYLLAIAILGVIIGASGLGLGAFTMMQVQTGAVAGDDGGDGDDGIVGEKGDDGTDGQDAPGGIIVGIIEPDSGETISGNITIRAMIVGSENYNVKVYINSSINATYVPFEWDTTKLADGWWNVTVIATDVASNNVSQDMVIVYVDSTPNTGQIIQVKSDTASVEVGTVISYYTIISIDMDVSEGSSIYCSASVLLLIYSITATACDIRILLDDSIEVGYIYVQRNNDSSHTTETVFGFYEDLSESTINLKFQFRRSPLWGQGVLLICYQNSPAILTVMEIAA